MKKFLSLLLVGVLLMGIGGAVCVFEFSGFTYTTSPSSELFAPSTTSLSVRTPNDSGTIYFDHSYGYQDIEVAVDEALSDNTLRVDVYGPSQLLKYHIAPNDNTLHLYYETDPFKVISVFLDGLKHKELTTIETDLKVTVYASDATAKRIVIGPDPALAQNRSHMEDMRSSYESTIQEQRTSYEEQLTEMRTNYEDQLTMQRQTHEEDLQNLKESYEEQLATQKADYEERLQVQKESYEERLENLKP